MIGLRLQLPQWPLFLGAYTYAPRVLRLQPYGHSLSLRPRRRPDDDIFLAILALFNIHVGIIYTVVNVVLHHLGRFTGVERLYNYISNSKCYITRLNARFC